MGDGVLPAGHSALYSWLFFETTSKSRRMKGPMAPRFFEFLGDAGDDPMQPLVSQREKLQGGFSSFHEVTSFSWSITDSRTQVSVSSGHPQ